MILKPLKGNPNPKARNYFGKVKRENPDLYKKDWLDGKKAVVLTVGVQVTWRGWLYEEDKGCEVGVGWCEKGNHYIAWNLRHGHIEKCMWRGGKLYGK